VIHDDEFKHDWNRYDVWTIVFVILTTVVAATILGMVVASRA
jgi:hypothetical protein